MEGPSIEEKYCLKVTMRMIEHDLNQREISQAQVFVWNRQNASASCIRFNGRQIIAETNNPTISFGSCQQTCLSLGHNSVDGSNCISEYVTKSESIGEQETVPSQLERDHGDRYTESH